MKVVEEVLIKGAPVYTVHDNFITTAPYARKIPDIYISVFKNLCAPLEIIKKFIYLNLIEPTLSNYTDVREGEAFLSDHKGDWLSNIRPIAVTLKETQFHKTTLELSYTI